jgi:hypothetical protein
MEEGDRSELEMEEADRFPATDSQGLVFFSGFISGDLLLFGCIEFDFGFRAFWFDNFRRIGLMI